jgi:60 kDa SS-A/Ro ribonucleoprotein
MSRAAKTVCQKLDDGEWLRKSRLHPLAVLVALGVYQAGHGLRGKLSWSPDSGVVDALDGAFYKCFASVTPTGKNHLLALDISGSMSSPPIANTYLSPREAAAAMALVTVNAEANTHVCAFASSGGRFSHGRSAANHWRAPAGQIKYEWGGDGIAPVALSKKSRLDNATQTIYGLPAGGTDCSLPMMYALNREINVDVFVIYTDSETWAGNIQPVQALRQYREGMNPKAKLIVVGLVANNFSLADPHDSGMLDVVGFDTTAPAVMADFVRE